VGKALSGRESNDRECAEPLFSQTNREIDMASGNDMKAHNATFEGFIGLVKWGIIATTVITVFVIFMITK
jgi:hypothetical protein